MWVRMNYSGARSEAPDLIEDIEDWLGVWLEERVLPLVGSLGIAGDAEIFPFFFYLFLLYYLSSYFNNNFNIKFCAGNCLCLFVFCNKHLNLKPAFSNLLKCLSVFDIIFLVRKSEEARLILLCSYWTSGNGAE